jgi:hypothetical protein
MGGDMGRERMFDIHTCSGEYGILAENLGHRHNPLFSYIDSQEIYTRIAVSATFITLKGFVKEMPKLTGTSTGLSSSDHEL